MLKDVLKMLPEGRGRLEYKEICGMEDPVGLKIAESDDESPKYKRRRLQMTLAQRRTDS